MVLLKGEYTGTPTAPLLQLLLWVALYVNYIYTNSPHPPNPWTAP